MSKRKEVHVVPRPDGGWATRRPGADRISGKFSTQKQAIEAGREVAKRERGELVIHGQDGRIRDKDSFGNDPFPPRDKKH